MVSIAHRTPRGRELVDELSRRAARSLKVLKLTRGELSLALVSDAQIRRLNRQYRHRDVATDVLSFPMHGRSRPRQGPWLLGDVVISVDMIRRQARADGCPSIDVAERLLIHGLLHLLGYDHEVSESEARRMARRERLLATALRQGRVRRGRR